MSSDEENLEDLLKTIMENEEESEESMAEAASEMSEASADITDGMNEEDLLDIMNAVSLSFEDGVEAEAEDSSLDGLAIEDFGVLEPEEGELLEESENEYIGETAGMDEKVSMEEMPDSELAVDDFAIEDFGVLEPEEEMALEDEPEEIALEHEPEPQILEDEVDATFAAAEDVVKEEEEPSMPSTEADMLALLESMSVDTENADISEEMLNEVIGGDEDDTAENKKGTKKKVGFSKKHVGKKKGKSENAGDDESVTGMDETENADEADAPKKQGFFSKVMKFLTETDEEDEQENGLESGINPSEENKNILNELEEEDKKKKKKKVKGKKGKAEVSNEEEFGDGEEATEKEDKKAKKKRKKKENAVAMEENILLEEVKPGKKVSKKNVAVIAGLCLTMTAVVVVLCSIVPGFFEKREAREAFYNSDYEKSYELLYGKELDNSDTIIYNKCRIIMEMNRKLDAYHNYIGIGKGVQALDALMAGVEKYPDILLEAEEYHVTEEVDAIYETMLNILNDKYSLTEDVAKAIIAYDDLTYTRKLESIVNGTPFVNPNAEVRTETVDMLPEEQVMMEETDLPEENVEAELPEAVTESEASAEEGEALVEEMEAELPGNSETVAQEGTVQEETSGQEGMDSYDNTNAASGSQGELIQGIRQPINVEIHGQ